MNLLIEFNENKYIANLAKPISLAIDQHFNENQPNFFHAPKAQQSGLKVGSFKGEIALGSSCNVTSISLTPHCNGTHTESVQHIIDKDISVHQATLHGLLPSLLLTITPEQAINSNEHYEPALQQHDLLLTKEALIDAFTSILIKEPFALIIRTQPNPESKRYQVYDQAQPVPFFSNEAISYLNTLPIAHLLVDTPSIDRITNSSAMSNHHLFWQTCQNKSLTEMIYVPNDVADGYYLLNLQLPAFVLESAPSRPIIYPIGVI